MRLMLGGGLIRFVSPLAVASIGNHQNKRPEYVLKGHCEVTTVNGEAYLCEGDALEMYAILTNELNRIK
jgi:hypothetical protein